VYVDEKNEENLVIKKFHNGEKTDESKKRRVLFMLLNPLNAKLNPMSFAGIIRSSPYSPR